MLSVSRERVLKSPTALKRDEGFWLDFSSIGTEAQMQGFFNWTKANVHTHELIHRNQFLKDGKPHAPIGGHDGHVHVAI